MAEAIKKKFKLHLPHVITLIFFLIVIVAILTWIIPSGSFQREVVSTAAGEREVAVAGTYQGVEKVTEDGDLRQGIAAILQAPGKGIQAAVEVLAFVFIIGGVFAIMDRTQAMTLAREAGFRTLAVTGEEHTPLAACADAEILVPCGEEDAGATTKGYAATVLTLRMLADRVLGRSLAGTNLPQGAEVAEIPCRDTETRFQDTEARFRDTETLCRNIVVPCTNTEELYRNTETLCRNMERDLRERHSEAMQAAGKIARAEELILIVSDRLTAHLPEITLKFSEMCRISVRGFCADEFVHGIYNSVTDRSSFLFFSYGERSETERRLEAYYRERQHEVIHIGTDCPEGSEGRDGLQIMPLLMMVCAEAARRKGIDVNVPKDPEFHRTIGSKLEPLPAS